MSQDTPHDEPVTAPAQARGCRRVLTIGGVVMLLACGVCFYRIYTFLTPVPVELGPETTVIEGPLLPDGRVDYVGALNERMSEGVTPENNAVVLLLEAFGPEIIDYEFRPGYLELLGIPDLPLDGEHVINEQDWTWRDVPPAEPGYPRRVPPVPESFDKARVRPWRSEEFPDVAEWLEANSAPLDLIVAASTRSRFYSPLFGGNDPPVLTSLLPVQQESRSAARLLATRAMRRLDEGDIDGAWEDLLACHRLSRLIGQGESLITDVVAFAISQTACEASQSVVHDRRLTAEQARRFVAELESLSPLPQPVEGCDLCGRFLCLDAFQLLASGNTEFSPTGLPVGGRCFDWNLVLQLTNEHFDTTVEACRRETYREKMEGLEAVVAELRAAPESLSTRKLINGVLSGSRDAMSRELADVLIAAMSPGVSRTIEAEFRTEARLRLLRTSLVLSAFRAERGAYPESLEDLVPDDFPEVPLDPFIDEPFHYELTESGYRLYSVGNNMTDDGGLTYDSDPLGDDLIVETPAAGDAAP